MNKAELIDIVAVSADLSKADATRAIESVLDSITTALKAGDTVNLVGFGSFAVKARAARTGPLTWNDVTCSTVPSLPTSSFTVWPVDGFLRVMASPAAAIAAIVTPSTDAVTLLFMAGPMAVFYEIAIVIIWIVPTLGVLISSFRPAGLVNANGWWTVFTDPSQQGLRVRPQYGMRTQPDALRERVLQPLPYV